MAKKYVAICLCVLAVCAVFGLNARTEYSQIKMAVEHVNQSANVIVDDTTIIDCFAYVFEDFQLGQNTTVNYYGYSEGGLGGEGYIISVGKIQGAHTSPDGSVHGGGGARFFAFRTEDTAIRVMNALRPLTWNLNNDTPNSFWGNIISGVTSAINAVALILGVIFSILQTAFIFLTDAISTAWSAVEMALYILGLPVAL